MSSVPLSSHLCDIGGVCNVNFMVVRVADKAKSQLKQNTSMWSQQSFCMLNWTVIWYYVIMTTQGWTDPCLWLTAGKDYIASPKILRLLKIRENSYVLGKKRTPSKYSTSTPQIPHWLLQHGNVSFTYHLRLIPYPHPPKTEARGGKKSVKMNPILQSQAGGGIRYRGKAPGGDGDPILGKKSVLNYNTPQRRLL